LATLTEALGINNAGDFVGQFHFSDNVFHGFLDPPAEDTVVNPEPSTWLLMASGLAGLIFWRRRRLSQLR